MSNELAKDVVAVPSVQQTAVTPMSMLQIAIEKDLSIEKIQQLMDLQDRWERNEARKAYDKAMSRFMADPPDVYKNKHVSYKNSKDQTVQYDHATLDNLAKQVGEKMAPNGLSFRWQIEQLEGGLIRVSCIIAHELGHRESVPLQAGLDQSGGKNNIQALGSTVKYLQRYTLEAAAGVATKSKEDDDGAGTDEPPGNVQPKAQPTKPALPVYLQASFDKGLPSWTQMILAGKQSSASIIAKISSAYTMTDAQKATLNKITKQPEPPKEVDAEWVDAYTKQEQAQ